jgi:hypothetical protein
LLSEPFDALIMNGKMPGQWSAKESYPWLKENCPGMEAHVLYTFSNSVEPVRDGCSQRLRQRERAPIKRLSYLSSEFIIFPRTSSASQFPCIHQIPRSIVKHLG